MKRRPAIGKIAQRKSPVKGPIKKAAKKPLKKTTARQATRPKTVAKAVLANAARDIAAVKSHDVIALKKRVTQLSGLLDVAKAMAGERDFNQLLQLILKAVRESLGAERCSLFILDHERGELWSKIAQGLEIREIRMPLGTGIAGYVAQSGERICLADAYDDPRFDRSWDQKTGYRTRAMLCVPMLNSDGQVAGVVQAINKDGGFDAEDEELLLALGAQAAACIDNALLNEEINTLFEGFVKASVYAIESRDPTTSGHSERVAVLTLGIAENLERSGPQFKDVHFSGAELREIRYAALLHDFGKVGVREHVLVKANKLPAYELDRIEARFEAARRGVEVDAWKEKFELAKASGCAHCLSDIASIDERLKKQLAEMEEFWQFVLTCNRPTVLAEGSFERLHDVQARQYADVRGVVHPLLSDSEVEFLSINRGSLSQAERNEIESHVVHTYRFLSAIPWTRELRRVPVIAYAHHEKLDGQGYPRKLFAEEIPIQSRMMTVSDIYDALTASDRPYKRAVPHDKALDILHEEAKEGKVDKDLLRIFIDAKVHDRLKKIEAAPAHVSLSRSQEPA